MEPEEQRISVLVANDEERLRRLVLALLSPSTASELVTEFKDTPRRALTSTLTGRELEVLRLVSLGRANHEIAAELCLSSHTVKRHVAEILAKLHQRSRLDAVMHAIRHGVLAADSR